MRCIAVPYLHDNLYSGRPASALLCDPGLTPGEAGSLTPADLPLTPGQARAYLEQVVQLGARFANSRDLAYWKVAGVEDFHRDTAMAIRSDLTGGRPAVDAAQTARTQAQTELLLAWSCQDKLLEMAALDQGLLGHLDNFHRSLGVDEAEDLAELGLPPLAAISLSREAEELPWKPVVAALLALLPPEDALWAGRRSMVEELEDAGLVLAPADGQLHLPAGLEPYRWLRAPGYRLCGLRRPDAARPWLDSHRLLLAPAE